MRIRHLFISEGHNFFGHHGQPAGEHQIVAVDRVECVAETGLRGDRFFGYRPDYKGQITFFSWEVFETLRREFPLPAADVSGLRRNVITEGVELAALIGQPFTVQGVSFIGTEECRPCYWMDRAFVPGTEEWLKGRGGLRARIVSNGFLARDAG
ncbi:MAG: molybdenum cofactor biosysynthesis protein [Lacunisphaera sp.]